MAKPADAREVPKPEDFRALAKRMDAVAADLGLRIVLTPTGWNYQPVTEETGVKYTTGIGVYYTPTKPRGFEVNLLVFRERGYDAEAELLRERCEAVTGLPAAPLWPAYPCRVILHYWERARSGLIEPYFAERTRLVS
jgi:hypothetical protein